MEQLKQQKNDPDYYPHLEKEEKEEVDKEIKFAEGKLNNAKREAIKLHKITKEEGKRLPRSMKGRLTKHQK